MKFFVMSLLLALTIYRYLSERNLDSTTATVIYYDELLNLSEEDFVTGERLAELSDVAFYTREYISDYPSVKLHAKNIVLLNEALSDQTKDVIVRSCIFFIKPDWLELFIRDYLPIIPQSFVLITHLSDTSAGTSSELLQHPKLQSWYGCNMHPQFKTRSVPIGLENADMWQRTKFSEITKARTRIKSKLLYVYFNVQSNLKTRSRAFTELTGNGFEVQEREAWSSYIKDLSSYKFCASPEGNGVDTHRMWECLYLGVIPIVIKTPELYFWYSELPVLWIKSFKDVTPEFLRKVQIIREHKMTKDSNPGLYSMSLIRSSLHAEVEGSL